MAFHSVEPIDAEETDALNGYFRLRPKQDTRRMNILAGALADGARLSVVTRGALGSMASDGKQRAEAGVRPVNIVETLGAGDTFIAGFIAAHLRNATLQACLEAGRDAAAVTCTHLGGFPQTPLEILTSGA